ncbi:tRNA (adenosine(37)-N6)-threonylcarbamoyltransferase complex dimerization subunit type 1 TsaB [Faucicola atlantae]|uniref:tRNA (adenosine(37)-N6)-threonylcarbamoyltransferase complex dimerization subunit type 1 TsaB n=1 Tax=Faucicola atlantae TaxID=34059 RepID=UPI0025AFDA7B|nr:tRNA (adenosine(37)-N6)-threonylcarbamoyltransferase complex dimerization subunit type 1 TsaB [Moraxella atlantae]
MADDTGMILALDSVFAQCSVALVDTAGQTVAEQTLAGNRAQTQQILPLVDDVLRSQGVQVADMTAIAFNRGTGAFSGIRINTAVAQALAFAHDVPCVPVSSLQALAQTAWQAHGLAQAYAVLDARMQQVYLGAFALDAATGLMQPVIETLTAEASARSTPEPNAERLADYGSQTPQTWALVKDGALLSPHDNQPVITIDAPSAAVIGQLAAAQWATDGGVPAQAALPVYLRHHAWKTLAEQQADKAKRNA